MNNTRENTERIPGLCGLGDFWNRSMKAKFDWTEEEDELHFQCALAAYRGETEKAKQCAAEAERIHRERHEAKRRAMMREVFRSGAYSVRRLPENYTVPRWYIFHEEEEIVIANTLKGAKNAIAFMERLEAAAIRAA